MRPIDGDALLKEANADGAYGYVDAEQIANAPTIEVAPVEHGWWIIDGVYVFCSVCNRPTISPIIKRLPTFNYCPNC